MGIGPFVASTMVPNGVDGAVTVISPDTKLPNDAHTKLPKPRLSVAERLRRLEEAMAFLRQHLAAGPQPARVLLEAANTEGIAERTLHRAKDLLNVTTEREGGYAAHGQWVWYPPTAPNDSSVSAVRQEVIVESGQH